MGDDDEVFVKMFSSSIRGDTPASPEYRWKKIRQRDRAATRLKTAR